MNRNATAPLDDASTEPGPSAYPGLRSTSGILCEPAATPNERASAAEPVPSPPIGHAGLLSPGALVGDKYIICDVLGTGGAAVVYAAEQLGLRRVVALKVYPVGAFLAPALAQRFEREAQLLARVHHENVVPIFDSGTLADGSPYLVVQRLHGESLAARLLNGPLPIAEAVEVTRQVLSALSALSDAGIAHRDVKPDNLVLDRFGDGPTVVKLVDFGIAKDLNEEPSCVLEDLLGTPNYMAPEQIRGEAIDARCDLYALGAVLYEMLTGRTPHARETMEDAARATLFEAIVPVRALRPDCPQELEQIVMRALAHAPENRFATAQEMRDALDALEAAEEPEGPLLLLSARADGTRRIAARPKSARRRIVRKLSFAAAALLAAWGAQQDTRTSMLQRVGWGIPTIELSAFDAVAATNALPSELLEQLSVSATQLWIAARASGHELFERAARATRAWSPEPVSER